MEASLGLHIRHVLFGRDDYHAVRLCTLSPVEFYAAVSVRRDGDPPDLHCRLSSHRSFRAVLDFVFQRLPGVQDPCNRPILVQEEEERIYV